MLDGLLERLREDAAKLKVTIERYKSGSWKTGIMENGKLIDTTNEDLQRLEELLVSMQSLVAEWESQIKVR